MSSTSDYPNNVTSSRLDEPCPPPPAVDTTADTVHSPQYAGTTLPQRSEAQDIPRKQGSNTFNSDERPLDVPRKQESNAFNSQDIPRKQESNAFTGNSECPQDIPRKQGSNAFNSERPQDVRPGPEVGGVAPGGQSSLSQGHATMGDKIIGKTEKMIGKVMNDRERHERGEVRETSGKAAAARTGSD